ncbi:MAG: AMP-binding protein [Candidatus Rokubacteria bacterium]|nr:AMP-binding protein [Candidatus Rokubacteria bacterium]
MADLAAAPTLLEVLRLRARQEPEGVWFTAYGEPVTYGAAWARSLRSAAGLARAGVGRGDLVGLLLPTCREFFDAFFGAEALGAVPVPLYPTLGAAALGRILQSSGARAVVTIDWFRATVEEAGRGSPALKAVLAPDELEAGGAPAPLPDLSEDDTALIQYTSGSTQAPRGAVLSHRNLLANLRAILTRVGLAAEEVVVSWLPLYHDMGLIGASFGSLYAGAPLILLPPDLRNLRAWLEAITTSRAAFTASPDFGYRGCVRQFHDLAGLDLSSLRLALSGGEPVRPSTVRAFETQFGLKGVICPAYGLAEATLAVTMATPGEPARVDPSGRYVSSGTPLPGVEVRVVRDSRPLPPGVEGEIVVRGPGVMQGYLHDPVATKEALRDGWLQTGDLGFLDGEGHLFVTGRLRDLIVVRGENVVPGDVEQIVDQHPAVRYSAAIGVESDRLGTQRLIVIAEVRDEAPARTARSRLIREIARRVRAERGLRPSRVLLVRPHTIPKTSSGKIQHRRLAELFETGALREQILGDD